MDYDIDIQKIKSKLNDFLNVDSLSEKLVSDLIEKIEVGETITTKEGPTREIFITYTFNEIV